MIINYKKKSIDTHLEPFKGITSYFLPTVVKNVPIV